MTTITAVSHRVYLLEELMLQIARNIDELSKENRQFARELKAQSEQVTSNVNRTTRNIERLSDEMREFKDEMREFKDEMYIFREESQQERRAFNRQLAGISNKMGTLAEDMIAPSIPRILQEAVGCNELPQMVGVRIRKRLPDGRSKEYDTVAVCGDYLLINETKSRLRPEDVRDFVKTLQAIRDFFPEYADKQVVGALATFYVDPTLIKHGERHGFIMLGVIDGLMEILNQPEFVLKTY